MHIGIDFDNTIACYEGVFHVAAVERGLISADVPSSKNAIRDYLNAAGLKDEFTLLQGYVYGARMDLVAPYIGIVDFVTAALDAGCQLSVISHKTRHPIQGPAYDMHSAARSFLERPLIIGCGLDEISHDRVFFENTKEAKISRIKSENIDVFIDDLPEILTAPEFPQGVRALLFDPGFYSLNGKHAAQCLEVYQTWAQIHDVLLVGK